MYMLLKEIITLPKEQLLEKIEELKSTKKFFTVWFIKKDGTERKLTGRFGVTKHLAGGKTTIPEDKYYIIFDMAKKDYRAVNKETIFKLKTKGEVYATTS